MNSITKTQLLKLKQIRLDCGTQSRAAINEDVVAEYAAEMLEGAKFPPVTVFFDGSEYYLADGFHRVMAAIRNEFEDFECDLRAGTRSDALKYSLGANARHGLKRTNVDKRRSVELALSEWPNMSDRVISEICAVSYMLVADVRKIQLPDSGSCRIGADGKERRMPQHTEQTIPVKPSDLPPAPASAPETEPRETTLLSLFEKPLESLTPEQHGALWARVHPDAKSELAYHLNLVKADAEYLIEKLEDSTAIVDAGELKDLATAQRFAAKKAEAMVDQLVSLSRN